MKQGAFDRNSPEFEQMEALVSEIYSIAVHRASSDNQVIGCFISCLFTAIRSLSQVVVDASLSEMVDVSKDALDAMYLHYLGVNGGSN